MKIPKISNNKKIKQEINIFVWLIFALIFVFDIVGFILGTVGIVQHKPDFFVTTPHLSESITSVVLAVFSLGILGYLVTEFVSDKNPFRIEVSIRLFLLMICGFTGILSVVFGSLGV